jgi:hypothetical protein
MYFKIKYFPLICLFWWVSIAVLNAQMVVGADTLYGNEWIRYSNTYLRIKVASDGIYRASGAQLAAAGFPLSGVAGADLRLYRNGKQVPVFTSTEGTLSDQDYVEFWGQRNRDEVDRFLFADADAERVNPWFSMVNDATIYYLTWNDGTPPIRYTQQINDVSNVPPKTPWCWFTNLQFFTNTYYKRFIGEDVRYSFYNGDGYARSLTANTAIDVPLTEIATAGPDIQADFRAALDLGNHQIEVRLNDSLFYSNAFTGFKIEAPQFSVPQALANGTLKLKILSSAEPTDRHALSALRVQYPRNFNFPSSTLIEFDLEANTQGNYLEINGFNANNGVPVIYDQTQQLRLEGFFDAGILKIYLPAASTQRHIMISSTSAIKPALVAGKLQFRNFGGENANYVLVSNARLFSDPTAAGVNHVKAYADYRSSASGGSFKTSIVDVEELYEQFAYGVRFHPISIRNFAHYIKKQWSDPQYMLLIGKGLDHNNFRNTTQQGVLKDSLFFLPDFGVAGSDLLYVMSGNEIHAPIFSIGRLPVVKPFEIANYLDKVKEHELDLANPEQSIAAKAWHKRVLHISGGLLPDQASIASYVEDMSQELQKNAIGAEVTTLYKTSNDPVQLPPFEQVTASVNSGVSTWMYFGHTSPYVVDYDIGLVDNYQNKGKYPLMFIMGCFTGQCSNPVKGIGEQFLLAKNKGAIVYMATVYYSYSEGLHAFGKRFYENLGGTAYGKSVGKAIVNTVASFPKDNFESLQAVLHQMQLLGDPAIHIQTSETPDYLIDRNTIKINPNPVSIDQGTFKLDLDLVNIGKNTPQQVGLQFQLKDSKDTLHLLKLDSVSGPAYRQKLSFSLPTKNLAPGFGRLLASVDPGKLIDEKPFAAELNNDLLDGSGQKGVEVYLYNNDVQAVYPPNYAIIDTTTVSLQAAALSAAGQNARYLMQIDTNVAFNSPFVQTKQFLQTGGSMAWSPNLLKTDSTVYYWRVTRDSLVNGLLAWKTLSFTHLSKSPPGWSQSDKGQYRENTLTGLKIDSLSGHWKLQNSEAYAYLRIAYRIKEPVIPMILDAYNKGPKTTFQWGYDYGVDRGFIVVQYDPVNGKIIPASASHPYSSNLGNTSLFYEFDIKDSIKRIALMDFLQQELVPNAFVGILSVYPLNDATGYAPKKWALDSVSYGKNLFQVLESLGAKDVRKLETAVGAPYPYGFLFQNGNPGFSAVDTFVTKSDEIQEIRRSFPTNWPAGSITSQIFGPAKDWKSLHWKTEKADQSTDEILLTLKGIRANLSDTILYQYITPGDHSLASISTKDYPYLQLSYETTDTTGRTPTPLHYWRVLYDGYPEGALTSNGTLQSDTLVEGDTLRATIPFGNISFQGMDSVLVRFRIESDAGVQKQFFQRFGRLPVKKTLSLPVLLATRGLKGAHRLIVDVNPNQDQPELYHFNNILVRNFFVKTDDRNPLLDVSFDGIHILDGDLISPKPQIVITLKDDNRFLALQDTSTFAISLEEPNGVVRSIAWNDPQVQFFPADASNLTKKNLARLEWQPLFTKDGDYRLLVNGRDASGNASAKLDFAVRFKVITKSTLSNLLNYPNPFSTSTCFVYTMTGAETPTQFKLQIMTVSGKVVREITAAEFGPMLPGTHQSDYCWDGRDTYGDQLANGVYLYRVVAKKADGSDFEFFEQNNIDGMFKHGLGKMVLMR